MADHLTPLDAAFLELTIEPEEIDEVLQRLGAPVAALPPREHRETLGESRSAAGSR
jgi:hypothetical protein